MYICFSFLFVFSVDDCSIINIVIISIYVSCCVSIVQLQNSVSLSNAIKCDANAHIYVFVQRLWFNWKEEEEEKKMNKLLWIFVASYCSNDEQFEKWFSVVCSVSFLLTGWQMEIFVLIILSIIISISRNKKRIIWTLVFAFDEMSIYRRLKFIQNFTFFAFHFSTLDIHFLSRLWTLIDMNKLYIARRVEENHWSWSFSSKCAIYSWIKYENGMP